MSCPIKTSKVTLQLSFHALLCSSLHFYHMLRSTPTTAKRVRNASESIAEAEPAESGLETILVPPFERHAVLELQPLDPLLLHR